MGGNNQHHSLWKLMLPKDFGGCRGAQGCPNFQRRLLLAGVSSQSILCFSCLRCSRGFNGDWRRWEVVWASWGGRLEIEEPKTFFGLTEG